MRIGIFEFDKNKVKVNAVFAIILKYLKYNKILEKVTAEAKIPTIKELKYYNKKARS